MLNLAYQNLVTLPKKLPQNLENLECHCNEITEILPGVLPQSLKIFYCDSNELTEILPGVLPQNLQIFNCGFNELSEILPEVLPQSLRIFNCCYNELTEIIPGVLPQSLQKFVCYSNEITEILPGALPSGLKYLDYSNNEITEILPWTLPESLIYFSCEGNSITVLQNLPRFLEYIYFDRNPLKFVDNLGIEWWNERRGFNLKVYNTIKLLQRRIRIRVQIRHKKARIIQNGCHNWLYLPRCKDGSVGIVPRLEWKRIDNISEISHFKRLDLNK